MFHHATDAGKIAVWALTELVFDDRDDRRLIDVQWRTDHLATLGVRELPRRDYLRRLEQARRLALPVVWRGDAPRR
jgi:leucyl/phenylalanyl-tRNA--protein transferase